MNGIDEEAHDCVSKDDMGVEIGGRKETVMDRRGRKKKIEGKRRSKEEEGRRKKKIVVVETNRDDNRGENRKRHEQVNCVGSDLLLEFHWKRRRLIHLKTVSRIGPKLFNLPK